MLWRSQMMGITLQVLILIDIVMGCVQGSMISNPRKGAPNFFYVCEAKREAVYGRISFGCDYSSE